MAYFLAKTDPKTYSIDDLKRDGTTEWDGVRNPAAVNAIKTMKPGDTAIIYHSQSDPEVVGVAKVVSSPRPDKNDARSWVVDFKYVKHAKRTVTLREIKESHAFDEWALVRQGRLSTNVRADGVLEVVTETGDVLALYPSVPPPVRYRVGAYGHAKV